MTTLPDLLYVALYAVAMPLWDYLVSWPALHRQLQADPARARKRLWAGAIGYPWALVAVGAALWIANDRSWASLGFSVPDGWRLWVAVGLVLLLVVYNVQAAAAVARDPRARATVRQQFFGKIADVMPHTRTDLYWFGGVSLTAGFCEEFLFRGYFIWALAPWLGWWGAAALSVLIFASGHAYQGWNGALRTGIVGTFFTLVVAICGSLWPAIVLHALLDLGAGVIAWLALREGQGTDDVAEVEPHTEPRSASGQHHAQGTALTLAAILSLACTEHHTDMADPATLAAREARRQAFLADQEAISRDALRARRFRGELFLERPTVVAFYPAWRAGSDTVALHQRLREYAAVSEDQDWSFEERYGGKLRLTDSRSNAIYAVTVSSDSVGLLVAAPGYPPLVWYGEIVGGELKDRLRALRHWLPGRAQVTSERL